MVLLFLLKIYSVISDVISTGYYLISVSPFSRRDFHFVHDDPLMSDMNNVKIIIKTDWYRLYQG